MTHGSLFSGIGGFDLAAEWIGWDNVFHCEINEFCQKVLKYYWPQSKSYHDIKTTDFTIWRGKVDVISGGFPCQPFSQAGKRKGTADDRHLWPEMLRAIREIQPRFVVGENVPGLINWSRGMVLKEIKADLEAEGFEVISANIIPACAKDAPHRRDRLWIVAYAEKFRSPLCKLGEKKSKKQIQTRRNINGFESMGDFTDTKNIGCEQSRYSWERGTGFENSNINVANASDKRLQRCENEGIVAEKWENGNKQFAGLLQPGWENFPTQPPLCIRDDGFQSNLVGITVPRHRVESIKAYGNAIVPQVAYEIFKTIEQFA